MTTSLEKIVRPAQLIDVGPPRRTVKPPSAEDKVVTLKIDLAGSRSVKTANGNFSSSTSYYVEAYINEAKTPL